MGWTQGRDIKEDSWFSDLCSWMTPQDQVEEAGKEGENHEFGLKYL